jgi:hypothetical protein
LVLQRHNGREEHILLEQGRLNEQRWDMQLQAEALGLALEGQRLRENRHLDMP